MGTAIKHPVPDRVKPSFVIFDIHHMATVGVKGLTARVFTGETCLGYYLEPVYWKHGIIVTLC